MSWRLGDNIENGIIIQNDYEERKFHDESLDDRDERAEEDAEYERELRFLEQSEKAEY